MTLKNRIIEETTRLFASEGAKAIRMDDIAKNLGISKRTIYENFADKSNLILQCIYHFHNKTEARNYELIKNAKNIIEEFLILYDIWDKEVEATYNIMFSVHKYYPKVYDQFLKEHTTQARERLKSKLMKGVSQGYLLDTINIDLAISVLNYSLYGIMKQEAMLPVKVTEREAFRHVTTYFFRGIATEKGIRMIDEHFKNTTDK